MSDIFWFQNFEKKKRERKSNEPSVTDVVQTFSLLFGSHDHPLTRQRIFTVYRLIKLNNYEESKTRTRQMTDGDPWSVKHHR